MEAFSLLKYWKAGGGGTDPFLPSTRAATTTILTATAAASSDEEEEEEEEDDDDDNDDFFDLEFSVLEDDKNDTAAEVDSDVDDDVAEEEEEEDDRTTVSPSDDPASEPRPPPSAHQLPSLTKFRVFLLGLKKTKAEAQKLEDDVTRNGKLFMVDEVPLVSLFSSSRKGTKTTPVPKEGVQRYLKKVKPLYVKVSKLRSSISGAGEEKQASLPLRVVHKHLGKSRSGSLLAVLSPAAVDPVAAAGGGVVSKRMDDSLLLQQDGIQGAILHCKRSFNASRDKDVSLIPRSSSGSSSDPASHEKLTELLSRKPTDCHGRGT